MQMIHAAIRYIQASLNGRVINVHKIILQVFTEIHIVQWFTCFCFYP